MLDHLFHSFWEAIDLYFTTIWHHFNLVPETINTSLEVHWECDEPFSWRKKDEA